MTGNSTLTIAPKQIIKGINALKQSGSAIAQLGTHPLVIGGHNSLNITLSQLPSNLSITSDTYHPNCSENTINRLQAKIHNTQTDLIIGTGGGKALDTAKLLAHYTNLPCVTIPTSGATCAATTALSNIYSDTGAFLYDVALPSCPDLLIIDYSIIQTAPPKTLLAGIGDAIAKWYESSVSSGSSPQSLTIAAVQQARVLRDLLFQKSILAIEPSQNPINQEIIPEIIDATIILAGVIGGLGGASCRTVAAHAIHNGLTHLANTHHTLHGEKVAYGILVQLRLEEIILQNQLATTARQQLIKFYHQIGLPTTLEDLGLSNITLTELKQVAKVATDPKSDLHRLPFPVSDDELIAAMVSTKVKSVLNS